MASTSEKNPRFVRFEWASLDAPTTPRIPPQIIRGRGVPSGSSAFREIVDRITHSARKATTVLKSGTCVERVLFELI
jgi:hypothetical protein